MKSNLEILKELTSQLIEKDEELKKSQKKYYEMFNSVAHPMMLIDGITTELIEVNEEAVEVYGYSKDEFLNIDKTNIIEDIDNFMDVIKNKKPYRTGFDRTKNGNTFPVEVYYSYYSLDDKELIICSVIDITDKVNIIKNLTLSNEMYKGLIENTNELIVRVDLDNNFTFINDTYCKLFGIKAEEYLHKSFVPLVHPDDVDITTKKLEEVRKFPYQAKYIQRAMTSIGWRSIEWRVTLLFDYDKKPIEYQTVGEDLTDFIQLQEDIYINKEYCKNLLELFGYPVFITDLGYNIIIYNSITKDLIKNRNEELMGRDIYKSFIHENDIEKFYNDVVINSEGLFEGFYKTKDLQECQIKIVTVKNLKNKPIALIGSVILLKGEINAKR